MFHRLTPVLCRRKVRGRLEPHSAPASRAPTPDPEDDLESSVPGSLLPLLPSAMPSANGSLDDDGGPSFMVPQLPSRSSIRADANGNTSLKIPTDNGVDLPTDLGDTTEDDEVECIKFAKVTAIVKSGSVRFAPSGSL
ncbi:hypothetical protein CAPTEDRAFT_213043 [Capitella teleta]|uniref:Uncharacterized protein n=1 Tax=Capitella teleta TaxID=283909 RepID=R7UKJ5_CAPTE|nr:hypothetical protein CAPTEDRAFT_213043 [Capitella teleta]|eukprot:ELU06593.1 hypothetical protein CAPTEDRAFT_213043 [Capitella teleta]